MNMLKHLVVQIDREQGIGLVLSITSYIDLDVQVVVYRISFTKLRGLTVDSQSRFSQTLPILPTLFLLCHLKFTRSLKCSTLKCNDLVPSEI